MKKLITLVTLCAIFLMPTIAFAGEGDITISLDLVAFSDDYTEVQVEYAWSSEVGIGLDYIGVGNSNAATNPYARYYFSGDENSFYVSAGYYMAGTSGASANAVSAEFGYVMDLSMLTLDIAYKDLLSSDIAYTNNVRVKLGIAF